MRLWHLILPVWTKVFPQYSSMHPPVIVTIEMQWHWGHSEVRPATRQEAPHAQVEGVHPLQAVYCWWCRRRAMLSLIDIILGAETTRLTDLWSEQVDLTLKVSQTVHIYCPTFTATTVSYNLLYSASLWILLPTVRSGWRPTPSSIQRTTSSTHASRALPTSACPRYSSRLCSLWASTSKYWRDISTPMEPRTWRTSGKQRKQVAFISHDLIR